MGLSLYIQGLNWEDLRDEENLISSKGSISEQFIAQHLAGFSGGYEPPQLYYWLREGKSTNAEVDFVLTHRGKLHCIEVKSGTSGRLRSLNQLVLKTGVPRAYRFDLNPPSIEKVETAIRSSDGTREVAFQLNSYPAYAVETFLENLRET